MISIYTRTNNIFSKEYLKWFVRKILHKKGGPDAVLDSLVRGFTLLNIPYEINSSKPTYNTVHVLSGISALRDAIRLKKTSKIKSLMVGPNLVTMPDEYGNILSDKMIDAILLPSQWTADFYKTYLQYQQTEKIFIWPAGVAIPEQKISDSKKEIILLFIKNVDKKLAEQIENYLQKEHLPFHIIRYGTYTQSEYFSLLEKSKLMIYLQVVESQGIALQEAWARNVPTLVLEKNEYVYVDGKIAHGHISAPYLNKESGLFFKDFKDFTIQIKIMMKNKDSYSPRKYCIENLSDKVITKKYVSIIKKINTK